MRFLPSCAWMASAGQPPRPSNELTQLFLRQSGSARNVCVCVCVCPTWPDSDTGGRADAMQCTVGLLRQRRVYRQAPPPVSPIISDG